MEKHVRNYRIIIEPETVGKKTVYNAYCPSVGIADYGDSVEEVLKSIRDGIELALESLAEEKQDIPQDNIDQQLITAIQVSKNLHIPSSR